MLSGQQDAPEHSRITQRDAAEDDEDADEPRLGGRPRRAAQQNRIKAKTFSKKHTEDYDSLESMDDESDATSSGNEWDGGDEDEPDGQIDDEEEDEDVDMSEDSGAEEEDDDPRQSLVVSLRYKKSRRSPANQGMRNGLAASEDHNISLVTTSNSKGPSETPFSTDGLTQLTQDAAPTHYSRPTNQSSPLQQAPLADHVAPAQFTTPTASAPQISSHSSRGTRVAPPEKDHTHLHSDYSRPEQHRTPRVSWPSAETGVLASNGTQM